VLPTARVNLEVLAEDTMYAVRSVHVDVRARDAAGRPKHIVPDITLHDHQAAARVIETLQSALAPVDGLQVSLPRPRLAAVPRAQR
ncbi:hypothetical protein ABTF56_20610, partial [Acinetobacter baumannii]